MLGEMQVRKMNKQLQVKLLRKLNFKIYSNLGFNKMINQKKVVSLQILLKMISYLKLIKYLHGKKKALNLILANKIKSHVGIAIKYLILILKINNINMVKIK